MVSGDFCEHDWPGSGCKDCRRERYEERLKAVQKEFPLGTAVTKTKGSSWSGHVVGYYTTDLTHFGVAIESINEPGSVQIYPVAAIRKL